METDTLAAGRAPDQESFRTSTLKSGREPRIELITRNEPRRRWSTEQKQAIAAESLVPGASPSVVARRYGISSGLLYACERRCWQRSLASHVLRGSKLRHVRSVRSRHGTIRPCWLDRRLNRPSLIEIALPGGTTVRVDAGIDPRALRRVLAVLCG